MLVISGNEVRTLLDLGALDDALAPAMSDLSEGRASTPDRIGVVLPHSMGGLAAMPCYVPALNTLVAKLITMPQRSNRSSGQTFERQPPRQARLSGPPP